MTQFEDVLETILEEYARRDSEGEFDTWEETDAFVKEKAEVLLAYAKDQSTIDLGDYINELSKQFPEVSFAKLSRIAVRVAKWQYQQGYHQAEKDLHKSIYKAGVLDGFEEAVEGQYEKGYEQAEKDLKLSWEDISKIISIDQQVCGAMGIANYTNNHQQAMEEVLKRFQEMKGRQL